ncbi:MAG: TonB-dependent receptor [Pseudomonadota bacterium]
MDFLKHISISISLLISSSQITEAQIFDEFSDLDAPLFVTPSRMASSYQDAPNSVTRLEADDLYHLGITNVADALRLVPGMLVSDVQSVDPVASYHGTNVNVPRRMEVLFNSNSIYRPGYANVQWQRLPVDINDLTAIEVVRGSNVVDFGSNAFLGTVNLIPAQAILEPVFSFETRVGNNKQREIWLSNHFSIGNGEYIFRYSHKEDGGFDSLEDGTKIEDHLSGDNFLLLGEVEIGDGHIIDFTLASNKYSFTPTKLETLFEDDEDLDFLIGDTETPEAKESSTSLIVKYNGTSSFYDSKINWSLSGNYVKFDRAQDIDLCLRSFFYDPLIEQLDNSPNIHLVRDDIPLVLETSLNTGVAQLDQSIIAPLSESDIELLRLIGERTLEIGPIELLRKRCGTSDISVEEKKYDVDGSFVIDKRNVYSLSTNVGFSNSIATSQHYLNGTVERSTITLSSNIRYHIIDNLIFNFGVHFEKNDRVDEVYPSSRVSINWSINPYNIFRITASHSERSPDIYELDRFWNFYVVFNEGVTDHLGNTEASLPRNATSPDSLESEKINSAEISYVYNKDAHTFDIKYFKEHMYDLISEPFFYMDFKLTNDGMLDLKGTEFYYSYSSRQYSGLKTGLSYMYLDNTTDTKFEETLYAKNTATLFTIIPLSDKFTLGTTIYYFDELAENNYKRLDMNLTYSNYLQNADIKFRLNYRYYPEIIYSFTEISATEPIGSKYKDIYQLYISMNIEF